MLYQKQTSSLSLLSSLTKTICFLYVSFSVLSASFACLCLSTWSPTISISLLSLQNKVFVSWSFTLLCLAYVWFSSTNFRTRMQSVSILSVSGILGSSRTLATISWIAATDIGAETGAKNKNLTKWKHPYFIDYNG